MIINPISYPGNKAKLITQICQELPIDGSPFIDIFCGSGVVAANSGRNEVICNDISTPMITMLRYMYETPSAEIIASTERIIKEYGLTYSRIMPKGTYVEQKHEGLSNYNREGYNRLKEDYNRMPTVEKLFVLLIYGFNHYARFNKTGVFNVPVGKVDFSQSIYNNTISFVDGIKQINFHFRNDDFRVADLYEDANALYYFDPPYLITNAPYNQNWEAQDDLDLMEIIDTLNARGAKFMLSNVFLSNGKRNIHLEQWAQNYNIVPMRRQYRNASYQKKNITDTIEVLIKNF